MFRPELLPPATSIYGEIRRPNRKGWGVVVAGPPCHKSKSGKSFFANVLTGKCKCHGCGFSGDGVAYVMKREDLGFKDAVNFLHADDHERAHLPQPTVPVRMLALDFSINGDPYTVAVKDEPRNYADKIRRFYREAGDRLIELCRGDSESYSGEREDCWARMALALDELREMGTV